MTQGICGIINNNYRIRRLFDNDRIKSTSFVTKPYNKNLSIEDRATNVKSALEMKEQLQTNGVSGFEIKSKKGSKYTMGFKPSKSVCRLILSWRDLKVLIRGVSDYY